MIIENVKSNIPNLNVFVNTGLGSDRAAKPCPPHYHDEVEIIIIDAGTLGITINGTDYYASAGQTVYIASSVPHCTFTNGPVEFSLLQFKDSDFVDFPSRKIIKYTLKLHHLSEAPIRILDNQQIVEEFLTIIREQSVKQKAYQTMIRASLLKIIGILHREGALAFNDEAYLSSTGQKILPALSYINENYKEDISLTDISARLGFNESYFCRVFKQSTGATFTEYLNFVRICKAEKLLRAQDLSILDISSEVGFASVSYFNRIFKKYRSCSPSYYRNLKYCKDI